MLATACGILVAAAMFGLAVVLVYDSWPAISGLGTQVITTVAWSPSTGQYGALAALAGTALSTLVAMVIAVPLALVIALLLVELVHPAVGRVVGMGIEMLAAIPSIIFGMVGLFVIVPFIQERFMPWLLQHAARQPSRPQARHASSRAAGSRSSPPASCWRSWSCRSSRPSRATCS